MLMLNNILILTIIGHSIIFFTILFKTKASKIKMFFIFTQIGLICWILALALIYMGIISESSFNYIGRISFLGVLITLYSLLLFTTVFPNEKYNIKLLNNTIILFILKIFVLSISFMILIGLVLKDVYYINSQIITQYGTFYPVYFILIVILAILIVWNLLHKKKFFKGDDHQQIVIILNGLFVAILIALFFNLIIPAFIKNSNYGKLGASGSLVFVIAIFYAIIKYQFLEINIFFSRLTYYAFMGMLFFWSYFMIYYFDIVAFGGSDTIGGIIFGVFLSFFFSMLFSKIIDILRTQVRSRLINPGYDPLEVLNELNKKIAKTLRIREIAKLALDTLEQTLRPEYMGILIIPKDKSVQNNIFLQRPENSKQLSDLQLNFLEKIWKIWTQKGKCHLNIDVLEFETPKQFKNHKKFLEKIKKHMKKHNIKLITPLKQTDDNIGILILGPKAGAYPYVYSEMDFVDGISNIVGLAVTRALYYLQVQDLNENLKEKIKIATHELKKKNASIRRMYNNLKKIRQREQDMMDIMGHELRTPLTITRNVLSIIHKKLERKQPVTERLLKSYIPKAYDAARREIKLVETMLSATKADAGRLQVRLDKVSTKEILTNTFEGYKQHAKNKGLKFIVEIPKKDLFVYADKLRLQEIVDNFTSNAIKYTMAGKVEVFAERLENHQIKISVKDTGMGIDEKDLKNIGKKFFRAKQYLKGGKVVRPGGTGLGLYVAFNLTKLMGGELEVKSKVGEGSLFAVIMPEYVGQKPHSIDQTFEDQTLEELKKLAE